MKSKQVKILCGLLLAVLFTLHAQDEAGKEEPVAAVDKLPTIKEIVRINEINAFFLDDQGQIGIAQFTRDLKVSDWDYYSNFQWAEARHLAVGRKLSVVSGTSNELTQAFDTDEDGLLDFFQDTISDWPGKEEGATISCGPVTDNFGRLLFGVAPKALDENSPKKGGKVPPSTLFSWNPGGQKLTVLATSSLPIAEMTVSPTGLLAAWIQLPSYTDGYYIAIKQLPGFDPKKPDEQPVKPPKLQPDFIIPADITGSKAIGQLCFSKEQGVDKLFIVCPDSKRLIELSPEEHEGIWKGSIVVRETFKQAIFAAESMELDRVLLGGESGFSELKQNTDIFRYKGIKIAPDAIEITFTQPVDRAKATAEIGGIQLGIIPLEGNLEDFDPPEPVIESDGKTVVMKLPKLPSRAMIKIEAPGLTSEDGDKIISPLLYFMKN